MLLFVIALPAVTHRLNASDEIEYFAWLRSAAFDRDVDFENEYQHFYDASPVADPGFHETFLERRNENGLRHNFAPMGTAVLWAPFYLAGHVAAWLTGAPRDGYSQPYITAVTFGSACYGLLALLLSHAIARRVVGRGAGATAIVWLGTPLLFYMYVAPGFSHACSAFAASLMIWTWLLVRGRWTVAGAMQVGVTGALLPMVREQDLLLLAGPALDVAAWLIREHRASRAGTSNETLGTVAATTVAGIVTFALAYAPQLLAYTALNGHPGPTRVVTGKMTWTAPHFLGVLFSPEHGLFFWTPLALVAVLGLVRLAATGAGATARDARWIGALALVMCLLQAYVSGSVESWTVAGSFGQRRFVSLTPLFVLGLAALWPTIRTPRPRRVLFGLTAALAIWWNLGLMAQFGLHTMDRQRLTLAENARATFIDLPLRAPSIAWRYLTDRESFYGRPRQ